MKGDGNTKVNFIRIKPLFYYDLSIQSNIIYSIRIAAPEGDGEVKPSGPQSERVLRQYRL